MKVNEATLQNILKAYGKKMRPEPPAKEKPKLQKDEYINKNNIKEKLVSEDLDIVNYDKDGNIKINSQKKDALIDFFE